MSEAEMIINLSHDAKEVRYLYKTLLPSQRFSNTVHFMSLSPLSIEDKFGDVDAQISSLTNQVANLMGQIQSLRTHRNTLVSISRLPPEVLCKIFLEVRGSRKFGKYTKDWFFSDPEVDDAITPSLEWVVVTHVCSHWRQVAIHEPRLWTYPPLTNPKWTSVMLERSRATSIPSMSLFIDRIPPTEQVALKPHITRTQTLILQTTTEQNIQQFLSGTPSTLDVLHALSVVYHKRASHGQHLNSTASNFAANAMLFPHSEIQQAPKLRHLRLDGTIMRWSSPLLANLTTLTLRAIPNASRPSTQEMRTILRRARNLKNLTLEKACPHAVRNPLGEDPVLMQDLETLYITDGSSRLVFFFRHIFSATTEMKAATIKQTYQDRTLPPLDVFTVLHKPYIYSIIGTSTDIRTLEIGDVENVPFMRAFKILPSELNLEPEDRSSQWDYHACNNRNTLTMDFPIAPAHEFQDVGEYSRYPQVFVRHLFDTFTWDGLRELDVFCLRVIDDPTAAVLASTFGTLPRLRVLTAGSKEMACLLAAPTGLPGNEGQTDQANVSLSVSFPAVQHLRIYASGDGNALQLSYANALCQCLQQRNEHGSPITSVTYQPNANLESKDVVMLRRYVRYVVVKRHRDIDDPPFNDYSPYKGNWYE